MGKELPGDIIGPEGAGRAKPIETTKEGMKPPARGFETFMKEGTPAGETAGKPAQVSPFDLPAGRAVQAGAVNMDTILGQMNSTSGILGDVQNQLNTKNLKLKQSQKYLLRNKLTEANAQIRAAASKTGVDIGEPPSMMTRQNPIAKFLALVVDGATQMNSATQMLTNLKMKGENLNPGDMLLIQVKLAKAQQELEYTSVLLSKAVDDIKMLFNVQI